jgi:hypothetical protein
MSRREMKTNHRIDKTYDAIISRSKELRIIVYHFSGYSCTKEDDISTVDDITLAFKWITH